MNGISEQDFFELSTALCESVGKYQELEKQNASDEEINAARMNMCLFASELIDVSQYKIATNDENIKLLFQKMFELAGSIKQRTYYISHLRNAVKKAQNDSEIDKATEHLYINNRLYNKLLDNTYSMLNEINNFKSKTK